MALGAVDFTWPVEEGGYRWAEPELGVGAPPKGPEHHTLEPVQPASPIRHYHPLAEFSGLFRTFAGLSPRPDGAAVLAFANRFGLLGSPPPGFDRRGVVRTVRGWPTTWHSLGFWRIAISEMAELVEIWDWAQQGNQDQLSQHFQWEGDGEIWYASWPDPVFHSGGDYGNRELIFSEDKDCEVFGQIARGDSKRAALFFLQSKINGWLHLAASPKLLWGSPKKEMALKLVPGSLLAGLWVQFARAIDGNLCHRRCLSCDQWFELSPEAARISRRFCSDACKSRNYRERQDRARQMHAAGKALPDIAEALGAEVEVVEKWIKSARKED
jgi:hypothetical protein